MKPSIPYLDELYKRLQDPDFALGYLKECLRDPDKRVFLLALRDVANAQGGFTKLARGARLRREHLYHMLSKKGNPGFVGLASILNALGFELTLESRTALRLKKAA